MKGWYKISNGILQEFEASDVVYLSGHDIIKLFIPNGVKNVHCVSNKLTELYLPDSIEQVYCIDNQLTELIVPDDCTVVCDESCNVITRTELRSNRLKTILK
jgi:hypothetical protein